MRSSFSGERWTQNQLIGRDPEEVEVARIYGLNVAQGEHERGLGKERIRYGSNSGYQAINLAYLWGAQQIVLLGFDMQMTGGKRHFFGDHPPAIHVASRYDEWLSEFVFLSRDLKREGVDVFNCTRSTALDCFAKLRIDDLC